jgi:hypothetical protein
VPIVVPVSILGMLDVPQEDIQDFSYQCAFTPAFSLRKLLHHNLHHCFHPTTTFSTRGLCIHQRTVLSYVPSISIPVIIHNSAPTLPIANTIESIRKSANSLGKFRVRLDCTLVIADSITDTSLILNSICKIGQSNVKRRIVKNGLLIHFDGCRKMIDVF